MLEGVTVQAGSFRLREIDLEIPAGQYGILMGRTGSGKTTLLEAICGLRKVVHGRIVLQGRDVTHLRRPNVGSVTCPRTARSSRP